MKKIAIIVVSLVTAGGIAIASIAHAYGDPSKRADRMVEKISHRLDLNEAQIANLESLKTTVMAMREDMRDTRSEAGQTVEELLSSSTFDEQKAIQLIDKPMTQVKDKMPEVISAFGVFWNSLDAEQQAEIKEKFEDRMDHREWHYERSSFEQPSASQVTVL